MAMTVTSRGAGSTNTAGQSTLVISPTSNIAEGSTAVLCLSYDNSGTNGADPFTGVSDSKGNTWNGDANGLKDPGAASAGIAGRIQSCIVAKAGGLTTSDTITVAFGGITTVARAWALYEITPNTLGSNYAALFNSAAASQTSATPSITTTALDNATVLVACVARERNGTRTADSDTSNGSWANTQSTGVGTTTSGAEIICQTKIVTASATQTYNPTFGGASADGVNMWAYYEDFARSTAVDWTRTASDTVTFTDSTARVFTAGRTGADTVTITDAASRVFTAGRTASDTVTFTDAATRIGTLVRTAADTVTHSDAATRIGTFLRTAADTVTFTDAAAALRQFVRTAADTVTFSDAATRLGTFTRTAADSVTHTDAATRVVSAVRTAADTVTHSDAATRLATLARTAADTVSVSDVAAALRQFVRTAGDTVSFTDAASRVATLARTAAQTVTFTDAATRALSVARTAADTVSVTDAATRVLTAVRAVSDAVSFTDAVSYIKSTTETVIGGVAGSIGSGLARIGLLMGRSQPGSGSSPTGTGTTSGSNRPGSIDGTNKP